MSNRPSTGERFMPQQDPASISYEHWHRYLLAQSLLKNKIILDIACGEGYGSHLLAETAKHVTGIDIDEETVSSANERYAIPNLTFQPGSIDEIPIAGQKQFDAIVSFETIEHVAEPLQEKFLKEVSRLLKPRGLFLVSTPDKKHYSDEPNFQNAFHKKEFYVQEFYNFLKPHFKHVTFLKQRLYPVSYIWQDNAHRAIQEFSIQYTSDGFQPSDASKAPHYILAFCSNGRLPKLSESLLIDLDAKLTSDAAKREAELGKVLEQQANDLTIVGEALREKEKQINDLGKQLYELDAERNALKARLEKK